MFQLEPKAEYFDILERITEKPRQHSVDGKKVKKGKEAGL